MAIVLSIILFFFSSGNVMAMEQSDIVEKQVSVIEAVRVRQLGGEKLVVELSGKWMGHPDTIFDTDCSAELRWGQARLTVGERVKGVKNDAVRELRYDYPLAKRLNFLVGDDGSLRMRITGVSPLRVSHISGMEGSDSLSILLEVSMPSVGRGGNNSINQNVNSLPMGERVTLSMRDVSPADALRALASLTGVNLAVDNSALSGKLTFSFKAARFDEVLNYLLSVTGLSHTMKGNTLYVGSYEMVASAAGDYETRAYRIAYADMDKAAKLVAAAIPQLKAPLTDERTRTLYITATAAQHERAESFLQGIDHPGRQVMLEARLIDVNESAKHEVEAMISSIHSGWIVSSGAIGGTIGYVSSGERAGLPGGWLPPSPNGHQGKTIRDIDVKLRAIESKQKVKVLASPSLVTLDSHKAVIKLTRNYLYQSSVDSEGNAKFTEQETGPSLEITPTIGRDGYITMRLKISSGEIIGFRKSGSSESPETSKREIDTCVRVRDGELFVIGGLYSDSKSKSVRRVPVLGHIPLLGELFTSRSESRVNSELAFIVVPHILGVEYENQHKGSAYKSKNHNQSEL